MARARTPVASALAGLEALLHLIDDVNPAATAHQLVGAMARAQRFQGVTHLHDRPLQVPDARAGGPKRSGREIAAGLTRCMTHFAPPIKAKPPTLRVHCYEAPVRDGPAVLPPDTHLPAPKRRSMIAIWR